MRTFEEIPICQLHSSGQSSQKGIPATGNVDDMVPKVWRYFGRPESAYPM
jgi:hypothetical protein